MFKDYSFINYMVDENGNLDENVIQGLIGEWLSNAKLYYSFKNKKYYMYRFKDGHSGVLLKTEETAKNKADFEDFQPVVFGKPIKFEISGIDKENGECTLLYEDKCLVIAGMDPFDFNEGDEVSVYLNFFAAGVEFRNNEEDYYNHLQETEEGSLNIFNISIGELVPPIGMIMGERDRYPYVKDETLSNFDSSFMVGSGKIVNSYMIETKIDVPEEVGLENNELQLGKYDVYEFETKIGIISAIVEDFVIHNFFEKEKIDKFELSDNSIIKVYGYFGAFIEVDKKN